MTVAIVAGMSGVVLAFLWWAFATAPEGFEDDDGWHAGRPDGEE